MEQQRKRPRRRRKQEEDLQTAQPEVLRCPYCRGELPTGALAGSCEQCHTLHHVACFAEHRGCSTHGCGGARAVALRIGSPIPLDFPRLRCAQCRASPEQDAVVARCACGRVLDVPCYEALGACGAPRCQRPVRLVTHVEAVAAGARASGLLLLALALVALLVAGAPLLAFSGHDAYIGWILAAVVGAVGALLATFASSYLLEARRLRRLPRPGRRVDPAKDGPAAPGDGPPFTPPPPVTFDG